MDYDLLKAWGFNRLLSLLIIAEIFVLLVVVSLLIVPVVTIDNQVLSVVSSACLVLLCLPLSLSLYNMSTNPEQKALFWGVTISLALFAAAGIFWFVFPGVFGNPLITAFGKAFSLTVYAPVLLVFIRLLAAQKSPAGDYLNTFIVAVNGIAALILVILVGGNYYRAPVHLFDTVIYTLSVLADIAILSLGSVLALAYRKNEIRYVITLIIGFFVICMIGDSLNLMAGLGLYGQTGSFQFVYDLMIVLAGIALLTFAIGRMKVTTVEEINKKLDDSRSLIDGVLMQSPEALCIFDADGTAVQANNAFLGHVGAARAEVIGRFNLFRDGDRLLKGFGDKVPLLRDGGRVMLEGEFAGPAGAGGGRGYYHIKVTPTRDSGGEVTGYIGVVVDITAHRKHEEELLRARAQSELYLDLMGHDINNMNQIGIGFLEMALDRLDLDNEGQMLIHKPLEAMRNSSRLIDNVKKIRRAGAEAPCLKPVDLDRTLASVVREYSDIRGRDAIVEYRPAPGCYVLANPLLRDVFSNLVNNAFKHSTGPLKVWIAVAPSAEDGVCYHRVSVEDNGPGIPDDIKQIAGDPSLHLRTRTGGSGLGLYLVKTLVRSFNGSLAVEDRVPGNRPSGTRVIVTLPAVDGAGNPLLPAPPDEAACRPVVDKNKDFKAGKTNTGLDV